jgi:hypothetical protein
MRAARFQSRDAGIGASDGGHQSDGMLRIVGRRPRALSRPIHRDDLARVPKVRQSVLRNWHSR